MSSFANLFNKTPNANGKFTKPYYSLRNCHADKVLDVAQDGPHAGSTILWKGYGGENQQFTLVQDGADFFIKSKKNGQFLTVESAANGARIYTAPKSNQPNQRFRVDESKPGSKDRVIYTYAGKALDVLEGSKADGARVSQWDYNGNQNQLWNFCDPKNITSSSS